MSDAEKTKLLANKVAVKETAFKAITAFVLNTHDTYINTSNDREEPLTEKKVNPYVNK